MVLNLNSLNFAQGIERLPTHISRRDFFLISRYVINEIKIHYLAQTKMVLRHLLFWLLLTITLYFFIVLVFPLEIPQIMAVLNPPSLSTWRDVENISESTPRTRRHISGIPPNERRCTFCNMCLNLKWKILAYANLQHGENHMVGLSHHLS